MFCVPYVPLQEIAESSEALRQKFEKRFHRTVSFGIGVNCGDAIVGNIGCNSHAGLYCDR